MLKTATSTNLKQLYHAATQTAHHAWLPHPVAQPDGTTLELCFHGRLHRAVGLINEAQRAGDTERAAKLQRAITTLATEFARAEAAAWDAFDAYKSAGGQEPIEVSPCPCPPCRDANRYATISNAEMIVAAMLRAAPQMVQDVVPNVAQREAKDQMWDWLKDTYDAIEHYKAVCTEYGIEPNWSLQL